MPVRRCGGCGWVSEPSILECPRCGRLRPGRDFLIFAACMLFFIFAFRACDACIGTDHVSTILKLK